MVTAKRYKHNPMLQPNRSNNWEAEAAFNGSVVRHEGMYHMFYRAISLEHLYKDVRIQQSTIGTTRSSDGEHWKRRRQFIVPDYDWEMYGCEDPRVTKLDDTYYIFYTAIGNWPPDKDGIRVGVATTKDMETIDAKHLVTPFNAKAMAMFPDRIDGKIACALTVHTDDPPARICLALFDRVEDIWNPEYWETWYANWQDHALPIQYTDKDHVELGAAPVRTDEGWVLVFSYIENYFTDNRIFRIDAALLELENPMKLKGQTLDPILVPQEQYEVYGMVPNVIFPSGAILEHGQFHIFYSACDTTVCRASITLADLLEELRHNPVVNPHHRKPEMLVRFDGNPIISPIEDHPWENVYTFNAGAILAGNKVHIFYRAMGTDETSVMGYAVSSDGLHIDERLPEPVYVPREPFEMKHNGRGFSGCEDPRLTKIGDTIYMCYTAYDGVNNPRIALSTIKEYDLLDKHWEWTTPILISAPGVDNKDSCIVSEKFQDKYMIFHRIAPCIWLDMVSDLGFEGDKWLGGHPLLAPRVAAWDNLKIGLNGPPEKTEDGWLLLYHGVSKKDVKYRMGAALLDLENPFNVIARLHNPIFEPHAWYENEGYREGTVFSNGQVIKDGVLYVYYGGADKYLGVATAPVKTILDALKRGK